jgi:hypothetical protein
MSQESRSNQKISSPLTQPTPINNPSVDAYADRLIDELFADIDQVLEGGSKLSNPAVKSETVRLDAITVPQITLPPAASGSEEEVIFPLGYSSLQPQAETSVAWTGTQTQPVREEGTGSLHLDYPATTPTVPDAGGVGDEELKEQFSPPSAVRKQQTVLQQQRTALQESTPATSQTTAKTKLQVEPSEVPQQQERSIGSQVKSQAPTTAPATAKSNPPVARTPQAATATPTSGELPDKLLVWGTVAALASAATLFILWLVAQYGLNGQLGQQTAASSTPQISASDAQLLDYMLRSVKTIDRQESEASQQPATETSIPPSNPLPPVIYSPPQSPNKIPTQQRVYIPIYPSNPQPPAKTPKKPNNR